MRKYMGLVAVLFVTAALVACGGDDKKTVDVPGRGDVKISEDLPDDFPDNFPVYDGADIQGSVESSERGAEGFFVTWTTGDSVDEVGDFYESELPDDWEVISDGSAGGTRSFVFKDKSDDSKVGSVAISDSGDGKTGIVGFYGEDPEGEFTGGDSGDGDSGDGDSGDGDSGDGDSGDGDVPDAELPDEVDLEEGFPTDRVPFPDDARVTSSTSLSISGAQSHTAELYVKKSVDDIANHFKTELPNNGWQEVFTTNSADGVFATYGPEGGDTSTGEALTINITPSDVDGYSQVFISVSEAAE